MKYFPGLPNRNRLSPVTTCIPVARESPWAKGSGERFVGYRECERFALAGGAVSSLRSRGAEAARR
eukprot:8640450-Pyramimonas_sp.AAC.1